MKIERLTAESQKKPSGRSVKEKSEPVRTV